MEDATANAHLDIEGLEVEFHEPVIDPRQPIVDAELLHLMNEVVEQLPS